MIDPRRLPRRSSINLARQDHGQWRNEAWSVSLTLGSKFHKSEYGFIVSSIYIHQLLCMMEGRSNYDAWRTPSNFKYSVQSCNVWKQPQVYLN